MTYAPKLIELLGHGDRYPAVFEPSNNYDESYLRLDTGVDDDTCIRAGHTAGASPGTTCIRHTVGVCTQSRSAPQPLPASNKHSRDSHVYT